MNLSLAIQRPQKVSVSQRKTLVSLSHKGWHLPFATPSAVCFTCILIYVFAVGLFTFFLTLNNGIVIWQSDVVVKVGSKNPILETLKGLLDRAAPLLVDEECIKELFKLVKDAVEGLSDEEDDEYEWHETSGMSPVGKKGLALLLVSQAFFRH